MQDGGLIIGTRSVRKVANAKSGDPSRESGYFKRDKV